MTQTVFVNHSLDEIEAGNEITLELKFPCGLGPLPAWLEALQEMRGFVAYAGGRRPGFLLADGRFSDPDDDDRDSYHILACSGGRVVGCTRLRSLAGVSRSMITSAIGNEKFEELLRAFETRHGRACEGARWIVLPEYRGSLGRQLVAATWAVSLWLELDSVYVLSGTREHQDVALTRLGARAVDGVPLQSSAQFDDDLRLMRFNVATPPRALAGSIEEASKALNLSALPSPASSSALLLAA